MGWLKLMPCKRVDLHRGAKRSKKPKTSPEACGWRSGTSTSSRTSAAAPRRLGASVAWVARVRFFFGSAAEGGWGGFRISTGFRRNGFFFLLWGLKSAQIGAMVRFFSRAALGVSSLNQGEPWMIGAWEKAKAPRG